MAERAVPSRIAANACGTGRSLPSAALTVLRIATAMRAFSGRRWSGRMISAAFAGSGTLTSTSAKNGMRVIVSMSRSTIGESAASDCAGSENGGRFAADTPVGNDATRNPAGEKPSQRFSGAGSTAVALSLIGIASGGMSRRRPVAEVGSAFV